MNRLTGLVLACLLVGSTNVISQSVYKCVAKGAITYSHEPCLGAEVVDTTPTQGLDKFGGQSRKGADVQRTEQRKLVDQALRPLTGLSPEQMQTRRTRSQLSASDQAACDRLDRVMGVQNRSRSAAAEADRALFEQRKEYRELRC
jgi:hypothetical protein